MEYKMFLNNIERSPISDGLIRYPEQHSLNKNYYTKYKFFLSWNERMELIDFKTQWKWEH